MVEVAQPNWVVVIGSVYLMYAFGFLMAAAWAGGGSSDLSATNIARRQAMLGFGGIFGFIGGAFQAAGQFVSMVAGPWVVVSLLVIIPVLLLFVAMTERWMEKARDVAQVIAEPRLLPNLAPMPRALITREAAE